MRSGPGSLWRPLGSRPSATASNPNATASNPNAGASNPRETRQGRISRSPSTGSRPSRSPLPRSPPIQAPRSTARARRRHVVAHARRAARELHGSRGPGNGPPSPPRDGPRRSRFPRRPPRRPGSHAPLSQGLLTRRGARLARPATSPLRPRRSRPLARRLKESGEPVGQVGVLEQDLGDVMETEVGYLVARAHWRRGSRFGGGLGVSRLCLCAPGQAPCHLPDPPREPELPGRRPQDRDGAGAHDRVAGPRAHGLRHPPARAVPA